MCVPLEGTDKCVYPLRAQIDVCIPLEATDRYVYPFGAQIDMCTL